MKKKIVTLALVIALLAIVVAGASLAYFTDTQSAENVFTMGDVDIELDEPDWTDPTNPIGEGAKPGIEYPKDPYIKNVGDTDVWVRMRVEISDYAVLKEAADKYGVDLLDMFADLAPDNWEVKENDQPVVDTEKDTITYTYYYTTLLPKSDGDDENPSDETSRLFTSVTIPAQFTQEDLEDLGTDDEGKLKFTITVYADAIQDADGFATVYDAFVAFDGEGQEETP